MTPEEMLEAIAACLDRNYIGSTSSPGIWVKAYVEPGGSLIVTRHGRGLRTDGEQTFQLAIRELETETEKAHAENR